MNSVNSTLAVSNIRNRTYTDYEVYFNRLWIRKFLRKKYTLWSNIVDLRSRGINITRTAERLGVSRDTVKRLQSLSSDELFRKYQESRRCKLQNYEQAVVSLLFTFPSTSSSRVHDYLKEHYPDFPNVCDKTVHNYVQFIRKKHHLPFRSCRL